MSFNYRLRDCDRVGRLAQVLSDGLDWLVKNGHPKWKSVDLTYPLKGWEQYDCVQRYLGKPVPAATREVRGVVNPVMEAINGMLSD
jgi:uncharacterized protein